MELSEWKNKNSHPAGYAHFDKRISINSAWGYITDSNKVATHSFYPFIHYDQVFYKFTKKNDKNIVKSKIRPICYSAHRDRCIYQYYGFLLNNEYNKYVNKVGISDSVVAYRTDLHKNNIHFAKEAFDFIKKSNCNIIVGDFTNFFDNLDHKYLKRTLCEVLEVKTLEDDWYAVFKNITKYSKCDLNDLLKLNNLISDFDLELKNIAEEKLSNGNSKSARGISKKFESKIKELNKQKLVLSKEEFRKFKCTRCMIKRNRKSFGIPQGSSISAVLSNVYMINFDKKIHDFVSKFNGLYLRYSDDFIIILPKNNEIKIKEIHDFLNAVVKDTARLSLQPDKTQIYSYENKALLNIANPKNVHKAHIDYLGFIFDGNEVTLRPKTVSKYYYRMYKKLNHIVRSNGLTKYNRKISYNNLYRTYTQKGRNGEYDKSKLPQKIVLVDKNNPYKNGNFFSYVYRADAIFNPEYVGYKKVDNPENKKEPITRSTRRHLLKIRRKRDKIK